MAAALLLPGLLPQAAAENPPDRAEVSVRWLDYRDRQPGLTRTRVRSPAVAWLAPMGEQWSLEGGAVRDTVSGASPRYHSAISSASVQTDQRTALDLRLNHHAGTRGWSLGTAISDENDFHSRTLSGEWRGTSPDRNRSWTVGAALTVDRIGATGQPLLDERRRTTQWLLGLTQVWSERDVMQLTATHSRGRGYHSDPYKWVDLRPRERDRSTLMLRWNHHLPNAQATLRSAWRVYRDNFGVQAQTVESAWVQSLGDRWAVTPSLRLYTQRAASFYVDPLPAEPGQAAPPPPVEAATTGAFQSADARLAGFGAAAAAVRLQWQVSATWSIDLRWELYEQRAAWRLGGGGSPGLAPFTAQQWQIGGRWQF